MSLLSEIEESLGSGSAAKKLNQLEAQLRPMYASLPKNEQGGLSHSVVRYALHRLFVQRHGWYVKGLDPDGGSFNSSSPADLLKDQVPTYIQALFEKRLHGKGMGLHELAVFAATIEHLVHNEAVGRLGDALSLHKILPTSPMTETEADEVLDTYMMAYILGDDLKNMTLESAKYSLTEMPEVYQAWSATQEFMRKMRADITASTQSHEINFATLTKVAESAGESFGSFQNTECGDLKKQLVAMEDRGSGRVRLADFYKPALSDSGWQFQESVGYLRQLGALDESDAKDPRVIIPNYLLAQTNCIASSSFYSVCCIDECESLMGQLEQQLAAPEATPERLVSLISALPSSSVEAPRSLPSALRQRLDEIAAHHDGTVVLHGRLFAQWLHHAFPRECPYPHVADTINPQAPEEWEATGESSTASKFEMLKYSQPLKNDAASEASEVQMLWSSQEELLIGRSAPLSEPASDSAGTIIRNLMLIASLGSVLMGLVRMSKSVQPPKKGYDNPDKLFV